MYTYYTIKRVISVFVFIVVCLQSCKPSPSSLENLAQNPLPEEGASAASLDLQEDEKEASQDVAEPAHVLIVGSLLAGDVGIGQGHAHHQIHTALEEQDGSVGANLLNIDATASSTLAHNAAEQGNLQNLHRLILQDSFDFTIQDVKGNTFLHILAQAERSRNAVPQSGYARGRLHMFLQTMDYIEQKQHVLLINLKEILGYFYPELLTHDVTNHIFPIVVDYVVGVDLSLANNDGDTVPRILAATLSRASSAGVPVNVSKAVASIVKKHTKIGGWYR